MSAPQTVSPDTVEDLVGQAIRQLVKLDRGDLAAAVQAALSRPQHIEVLMVRDPDHATEVEVFLNGRPLGDSAQISLSEFDIDPGAGWSGRTGWTAASPMTSPLPMPRRRCGRPFAPGTSSRRCRQPHRAEDIRSTIAAAHANSASVLRPA